MKRFSRLEDFLPTSPQQVLAYLKWKRYEIPLDKKTRKPSTGEDGLEKILRMHPEDRVIPKVLEIRRLTKAAGYLSDEHVGRDGCFHPAYGLQPKTGRLSSRRPNLMNVPQGRKPEEVELAKAIRSTIVPRAGYVFIERDWTGIEALLVGYFANDPDYMRLARLGVHDCLTSHVIGQPADTSWDDEKLGAYLKKMKKEHKDKRPLSKQTVHARNYLESEFAIAKTFESMFLDQALAWAREEGFKKGWPSEKREKEAQQFAWRKAKAAARQYCSAYALMAPKLVQWQKSTLMQAHKEGYLRNPFGFVMRFFDVLRPERDGNGDWKRDENGALVLFHGDESNEAIAFKPQSTGAGMLRSTLLLLDEEQESHSYIHPLVPIHDAILFECLKDRVEEGLAYTKRVMERPFAEMGGLWCGSEAKVGTSWSEMQDVEEEPLRRAA